MASASSILKLNNGVKIPALGFGTFAKEITDGETHSAVLAALDAGYRHIDCAWYYLNEDEVGAALKEWLATHPSLSRKDIFITTKVWPHLLEPEDVKWSLENSLKMLGVDYVDCFLIHWPLGCERTEDMKVKLDSDGKYIIKQHLTSNLQPSWRMLESLYRSGKTRSIGVSNWTIAGLKNLLSYADIKPAINQVEIHPYLPNNELLSFCSRNEILPVAYSPLGSQGQVAVTGRRVLEDEVLNGIAEEKGCTVAQVLIAWGLRRGYAVLPKSSNPARIRSNFDVIELDEADFARINKVAEGQHTRFVNPKDMFGYDVWADDQKSH